MWLLQMLGLETGDLNKHLTSKNVGTHSVILVSYDINQVNSRG